ncbi:hypothetical protein CDL15_Pgr022310 [Punica granatum]|uniref:Uncharacterized protein n=1 Tax=Punica granatum TaxID=22663 RepID=A0A218W271_PUNGR|nr:hypothetical protein CDL15_Pgr022310 [Punica granatum]
MNLRFRKVSSHGLANLAMLQEARARWLADPARWQKARARWLGELAVQEMKLARVSRPGKVARSTSEESNLAGVSRPGKVAKSTSEVARRTCEAGK